MFSPGLMSASGPAIGLARSFSENVGIHANRPAAAVFDGLPGGRKNSDQRAIHPRSLQAEWGLIDAEARWKRPGDYLRDEKRPRKGSTMLCSSPKELFLAPSRKTL